MNYYERYCGDYAKKTARLTLIQHGAYTLLLDEYYSTEQPLPEQFDELYRVCRAMSKAEQEAVRFVADRFFPVGEDGLRHNDRADEMIEKARPRMEAARVNGKKGGRPKKNPSGSENYAQDETQRKPNGFPGGFTMGNPEETQNESSPTLTPVTTTNTFNGRSVVVGANARQSDDSSPRNEGDWLRHMRSKHGLTADESSIHDRKRYWPTFASWLNAGVTTAQVDAAVAKAHADSTQPISNIVAYAARVLDSMTGPPRTQARSYHDERADVIAELTGANRRKREQQTTERGEVIDVPAQRIG